MKVSNTEVFSTAPAGHLPVQFPPGCLCCCGCARRACRCAVADFIAVYNKIVWDAEDVSIFLPRDSQNPEEVNPVLIRHPQNLSKHSGAVCPGSFHSNIYNNLIALISSYMYLQLYVYQDAPRSSRRPLNSILSSTKVRVAGPLPSLPPFSPLSLSLLSAPISFLSNLVCDLLLLRHDFFLSERRGMESGKPWVREPPGGRGGLALWPSGSQLPRMLVRSVCKWFVAARTLKVETQQPPLGFDFFPPCIEAPPPALCRSIDYNHTSNGKFEQTIDPFEFKKLCLFSNCLNFLLKMMYFHVSSVRRADNIWIP